LNCQKEEAEELIYKACQDLVSDCYSLIKQPELLDKVIKSIRGGLKAAMKAKDYATVIFAAQLLAN